MVVREVVGLVAEVFDSGSIEIGFLTTDEQFHKGVRQIGFGDVRRVDSACKQPSAGEGHPFVSVCRSDALLYGIII